MAQITADQVTIVDVTDAYSVILTSEAYVFPGTTTTAKPGSTTTTIVAMRGANPIACSVTLSEITLPTGITVTEDTNATTPTLTFTATTAFVSAANIDIPVHIGSDIVLHKTFSVGIAFTGSTGNAGKGISGSTITYQTSSSGTTTPTGSWSSSIPAVSEGQYLWTRTVISYTDGSSSTAYSVGQMGAKGDAGHDGKGISNSTITYQAGASGSTVPTGTWSSTIPSVPEGQWLWTRTIHTYTDNTTSTSYSVGRNGNDGADAITMAITSSNGLIFKNSAIQTVLTAHVYRAGNELTAAQITALGTIKWYRDGGTTSISSGATLTIDSGDVTDKATYTAQLEA